MGKHSRPTPRLVHIIFYLNILITTFYFNLLSDNYCDNNYFEFTAFC